MKFYEFEGTTEYAIICARNEEEALKCYDREAEDKWKTEEEIKEITKTDAINLFVNKVSNFLEKHSYIDSVEPLTKASVKETIKEFKEENKNEAFALMFEHELV